MKKIVYILCVLTTTIVWAQQPFINSLDKTTGTSNELVTISGVGFSSPTVYFGNGKATSVISSTTNVIEVLVPATATYGSVRVVNSNGLMANSAQLFTLSFDKDDAGNTSYDPQAPSAAQSTGQLFTYDLCLCDFDGDGLSDVVLSNNYGGSSTPPFVLTIAKNNSTPSVPSFTLSNFDPPSFDNTTHNIECGDLNGDGKPDLVVTSSGSGEPFVHVFENTSTLGSISFIQRHRLVLPTLGAVQRQPKRVRITDIDGDGKPDIIVGSVSNNDDSFFVYRNTFTGNVAFNTTPTAVKVTGAPKTGALYAGDFDNDGKQDLAVVPHGVSSVIYLMRNTSTINNIQFELKGTVGSNAIRNNVITGDFNNDGNIDIATTRSSGSDGGSLELFQNNSNFSFNVISAITSGSIAPWGLDAGDMNGDGKADIVVASLSNEIAYYQNNSGANISFATAITETTTEARNVRIGDINKDGKPDIVFVDRSVISQPTGDFRYIINDLCMTPIIQPDGGKYCNGSEFILTATAGEGANYSWTISGDTPSPVNTGTSNELDISGYDQNITVTVTATSPDGCTIGSSSRSFTVGIASQGQPTIDNPGVICVGDALTLTSSTTGLSNYHWSGPNGFSTSTTVATVDVTGSATSAHAGTYTLIVDDGDCLSPAQTRVITVSGPPVTSISMESCNNGVVSLAVPDVSGQFNYQWMRDGAPVGTNSATFDASVVGEYTIELEDKITFCTYESDGFDVVASSFSGPSFGATNEVCIDVETTFTSDQTGLGNTWEVEDPVGNSVGTFTGASLNYTFATTGSKLVRLTTQYASGIGCSTKTITVSPNPSYSADGFVSTDFKCPSEEVTLSFSELGSSIVSVIWDDANTTSGDLTTAEAGTYTATYTTNTGCEIVAPSIEINSFPGLNLTANSPSIVDGILQLADGQSSVVLSVDATVTSPVWEITGAGSISGSGASVTVIPGAPEVTVTVSGQTNDGCAETESVLINGGGPRARKSFSPNGDGQNDCWDIINSTGLSNCTVYILDSRGANVLKVSLPLDTDCIWDGNYNGKAVPEGVYYYVLKCSDGSNDQSGSILLAR